MTAGFVLGDAREAALPENIPASLTALDITSVAPAQEG